MERALQVSRRHRHSLPGPSLSSVLARTLSVHVSVSRLVVYYRPTWTYLLQVYADGRRLAASRAACAPAMLEGVEAAGAAPLVGVAVDAIGTRGGDAIGTRGEDVIGTRGEDVIGTRGEDAIGTRGEDAIGTRGEDERAAHDRGRVSVAPMRDSTPVGPMVESSLAKSLLDAAHTMESRGRKGSAGASSRRDHDYDDDRSVSSRGSRRDEGGRRGGQGRRRAGRR